MNINEWLNANAKRMTELSDQIWSYAELKFSEHQSSDLLIEVLEEEGFHVDKAIGNIETAFSGTFGSGKPIIGFLGEYDALDGQSQLADVSYKCADDIKTTGHGCGHHLLGVGALAAAIAVKEYLVKNNLPGTVCYFGCPGEEGGSGKTFMARAGVFDELDTAITWHPGSINGMFSVSTLSNIQCYFKFSGRSSHAAASPHLGRSALDSVELMNVGVNYLREHIISDARVHYAITNTGGTSPNVVQAEAEVLYLIRAPKITQANEIFERIKNIAKGAALMSETEVEIVFDKACSNVIPSDSLSEVMSDIGSSLAPLVFSNEEIDYATKFVNSLTVAERKANSMIASIFGQNYSSELEKNLQTQFMPFRHIDSVMPGSSDVGDVSWIVPTVQCMTTCYANNTPAHSWQMVAQGKSSIAHKGMMRAAEIMALTGIELIEKPHLIELAKEEHVLKLNGEKYVCPIPNDVIPKPF